MTATSATLGPGAVHACYEIIERLGGGAFGTVWRARRLSDGLEVALKVAENDAAVEALRNEAAVHALRIEHENVVGLIEARLDANPPCLALELVDGVNLREALKRFPEGFPELAIARILIDVASAVAHAHSRGLVHGDLKPENILLDHDLHAHVTDFGLGHAHREATERSLKLSGGLETTVRVAGTARYMAPEVLEGEAPTPRSDVYALGIIMFEMLTGRAPQGVDRPSDLAPKLGSSWDELFVHSYTRLERRFADAERFLELLVQHALRVYTKSWSPAARKRYPPSREMLARTDLRPAAKVVFGETVSAVAAFERALDDAIEGTPPAKSIPVGPDVDPATPAKVLGAFEAFGPDVDSATLAMATGGAVEAARNAGTEDLAAVIDRNLGLVGRGASFGRTAYMLTLLAITIAGLTLLFSVLFGVWKP